MPDLWLAPERLFDGERLHDGLALRIEGGVVAEVAPAPPGARALRGTVTPGFVDLQVNGGGGVLLNTTPTAQGMASIAAAHRRFGTVGILPTLITDAPEVMERAVDAALESRGQDGIAGIHLEGPHIALARRGTHAPRFIRPLDSHTMECVRRLREGGVRVMVTLAPEAVGPGQIAALRDMGAVVSLGHTDATYQAAQRALAEGASCFTHLFNAMSPLSHRAPGVVGAALDSMAPSGIICDGVHVEDAVVAIALRARRAADLMFLVSDAMPTVGGPDHFQLYDMELRVQDGRLVNPEGSLAGAHVTMAESVARLILLVGIDPEQALRMAVTVPAGVIGATDLTRLAGRRAADVITLAPDWTVTGTLAGLAA